MRSVIAFLLCVAVAQLSCLSVEAFSLLQATKVVAPTKAIPKAKAATAPAKKAAVKKVQVAAKKAPANPKAAAAAKARAELQAKAKAKTEAKAKANAAIKTKNKAVAARNAREAAAAKKKALEKAKKSAAVRAKKVKTTTSATAYRIGNSGTDAALAITKNVKVKKPPAKKPLFPGLQDSGNKKAVAKKAPVAAKLVKSSVVAVDKSAVNTDGALNPLEFGLQVVTSDKGQEATDLLIQGGLKFVEAVLAEGKKSKVIIPRGFDDGTGFQKKPKVVNFGIKELLDTGIFAGTEFLGLASANYDKYYVGTEKQTAKVSRTKGKIDKRSGKVIVPAKEKYAVNIGGQRVIVNRSL
jgi:chemotaxis protein histidine kinase CheA